MAECFRGDYLLSAEDILPRLDRGEPGFDRFLFSKIIENSRQPSRHLPVLFPPETLQALPARYLQMSGGNKRVRPVVANLTGRHGLVPELQWSSDMLPKERIVGVLREYKKEYAEKYGILAMGVFGLVARDEAREGSDVDICIQTRNSDPFAFCTHRICTHNLEPLRGAMAAIIQYLGGEINRLRKQ